MGHDPSDETLPVRCHAQHGDDGRQWSSVDVLLDTMEEAALLGEYRACRCPEGGPIGKRGGEDVLGDGPIYAGDDHTQLVESDVR